MGIIFQMNLSTSYFSLKKKKNISSHILSEAKQITHIAQIPMISIYMSE